VPDTSTSISREQRATADFTNAMASVRSRIELPDDQLAVDALTEAALRFGACELGMRRSDRLRVVGLHKADAKELAAEAMADHELGLAALPHIRPLIERISQQETDAEALALWREASPRLRKEWRRQVAEFDIEAVKAQQLLKVVDDGCDALERGLAGLGRHLSNTLEELERLRRSDDRGTEAESFPYWKLAIAAVLWGISVGVIYDMISRGVPWWQPFLWSVMVAIITFCIGLGC